MPSVIVDLGVVVLILGMTYALASEGLWGAALMFFNVLFAGLITFNFYEPLAGVIGGNVSFLADYADSLSLLLIFVVSLLLLRLTTESLAPTMVRFPAPIYHLGRWLFGLAASVLAMAVFYLAFHTAPIHKKMFYGAAPYDHKPPFGMGIDWQWLGFFQYSTGQIFANYSESNPLDPSKEYGNARVFDPRGSWLIDHQNARPYGDGFVPEPASGGGDEGEAAGGGGGGPAGPAAAGGRPGPGIPGGTAGAAAGLAPANPL
jgi:hypothetical protein